ncbi:MAG: hypothetical protein ACTMUB_08375 [cyanobacterium endosymbiont of Rhopalodia musculus]|uniref:hypothetical protein n=1 Tax=cyanobacterium endosymbiont of Epithemia clementina EcSB TaxID=3034674 RepID=UPI00248141D6|nr:hypothetical protein [cyanobacterium endosymbiont of Epithemia clementina EcSB]WGT68092.1 hypothetical protein P3F56_03175 [cyanobacterium endosymbiont of Epithemia clementina EcSB]
MGILMDGLQQQINELNYKFNQLNQMVEQVSQQISTLANPLEVSANIKQKSFDCVSHLIPSPNTEPSITNKPLKLGIKHKDILSDDRDNQSVISPEGEIILSRDLQVRRLTAQLTAAYNRIAALEEQLLAYRRSGLPFMKVAHSQD